MKSTQLYDFTLAANGSQVILADANFYKILTATGDVAITRDGGSTVRPMRAGRGEREVDFQRLTIRNISGAPNSGTIVVGDSNFIDDTIVLSSAINVRPEAHSGFFSDTSVIVANTPLTVFTPGQNSAGAILLNADASFYDNVSSASAVFVAKASLPTTIIDGAIVVGSKLAFNGAAQTGHSLTLPGPQYIPAGLGLYYISNTAQAAATNNYRACRYKLL